ncbi:MAG: DUF4834 family protein [Bacteroidota bacterium]
MIGFIRLLFLLLLIYFMIKFVTRIIMPFLLGSKYQSMNQGRKNTRQQYYKKKEGEVTIDYIPKKKKKIGKEEGEYIDYEELK